MEGYNIALKLNGKTIVGRTQDDLTIAAKIKESLTKDDAGETQYSVNGHDVTIKASALAEVNGYLAIFDEYAGNTVGSCCHDIRVVES